MTERPKSKGGRAPKLTPEMQAKICDYLRRGNYLETAASACGIHQATIRRWLQRGRAEASRLETEPHTEPNPCELVYLTFCDAVEQASAQAEADGLDLINAAAPENWRSMAWRLERRNYKRWGKRQLLEHAGPDGGPVQTQSIVIGDKKIDF